MNIQRILKKTDPYPNLVEYSPDVLNLKKKTKVLDILNTDKTCFIKINVESGPDINIHINFHQNRFINQCARRILT